MTSSRTESTPARVVLGVAGGVAAYKAVDLVRRLRERGYAVTPVLTAHATMFVGPLTFTAVAGERCRLSLFDDPETPIPHTTLGQGADVVVVAPATAQLIAKMAMGLADDLLTATLLATRAPVVLCPAMHTEMFEQPSVQENLATLRRRGVLVLGPDDGPLAGGDVGPGRLVEPEQIASFVDGLLRGGAGALRAKRVVVTAGGTREPIDAVRVISNRSSGKQGLAIATVAARQGADVTLVTAASLTVPLDVARRIHVIPVETAAQMATEVLARRDADLIVMAAAVADFTVVPATGKLKKEAGPPEVHLTPTLDILAELGATKRPGQVLVGFAAETDDPVALGTAKRRRKQCDLMVVNDVSQPGVGFDHATNAVWLIDANDQVREVSLRSKEAVAEAILANVAPMFERGAE